jgi:signal transduction histidine kinase/phage shock protein PspC (stress-responsive transcriptional regulator)
MVTCWRLPIRRAAYPPPRRLYRRLDDRFLAGVASGIAAHLGVSVVAVRIAFVVLLGLQGLGALLYAVFWAILPIEPLPVEAVAGGPGGRPAKPRRREISQMLPYVAIGAGILLLQGLAGWGGFNSALGWLVAIIAVGAGIIWHQTAPDRRRRWTEVSPRAPWLGVIFEEGDRRTSLLLRFLGGGVLVAVGIITIVAVFSPVSESGFWPIVNGALLALAGITGVGLVGAPMLWRIFGQLRTEREARIREQERAELAAMIHDQVLHTLALIKRSAGDPTAVQRLARGQERTLRNWLYKPTASPTEVLSAALEEVAAEVEDTYAIAVETVVVGDLPVNERVGALVAASREALVNAARHAKVQTVSLYAEVEPELASVFVRDRGKGFDVSTVDDHRHGVRGSIIGRMQRHGGRAEIRSEPGEGTEVRLTLPVTKEATS